MLLECKRMRRMKPGNENTMQTMQTLYENIVRVVERGYYESFKVVRKGLSTEKDIYSSNITIANLYKFQADTETEGQGLYLMKTVDGRRGTLIHSRNSSAHQNLSNFIQQVYSSNKRGEQTKFWFNFLTN